jgi:hypothetical protein
MAYCGQVLNTITSGHIEHGVIGAEVSTMRTTHAWEWEAIDAKLSKCAHLTRISFIIHRDLRKGSIADLIGEAMPLCQQRGVLHFQHIWHFDWESILHCADGCDWLPLSTEL